MDTAHEKTHISFSEIVTYLACRRKWGYRYFHRIRPTAPNKHLMLGSAIHEALGVYYSEGPQDTQRQVATLERFEEAITRAMIHAENVAGIPLDEEFQSYQTLGSDMLVQYFDWSKEHDDFTPKGVENKLVVPIPGTGLDFVGYVDLFAEQGDGSVWIYEHKTYTNMPSEKRFALDMQGTAYTWACTQDSLLREKHINGITYNVLLKKAPKQPQQLKNGGLSKDRRQSTTPAMYRQAVQDLGLHMGEYEEFITTLDPDRFNGRIRIPITAPRIAAFDEQLTMLAMMIRNAYDAGPRSHVACASAACEYCEFYPLCKLSFEGFDWHGAQGEFHSLQEAGRDEEGADAEDNP